MKRIFFAFSLSSIPAGALARESFDVIVHDAHIARIGDLSRAGAGEIMEAAGRIVAPGFIDLNSHADRGLAEPELRFNRNFLYQGARR